MSFPTYADLVRRFGLAFHPDKRWHEYGDHPGAYPLPDGGVFSHQGEIHDGVVRAAFANHESGAQGALDPYAAALAVWREDGLLGGNDPGPAPFRDAHSRYLAERAGPPAALILERDEAEARWNLDEAHFSGPLAGRPNRRPRLGFNELLDAVNEFNRNTSPLRVNVRTLGSFDAIEREFNVHQTRLRDWFEERGITVDPT